MFQQLSWMRYGNLSLSTKTKCAHVVKPPQKYGALKRVIEMPIEANRAKVTVWENSTCLVCGSKVTVELQHVFDTRFGIESEYDIGRCEVCGLIQTVPFPPSEELKQLYEKYYNFGGSKKILYTKLRRTFLESVFYRLWMAIDGDICFHSRRGNGWLLDIGCNEGIPLCYWPYLGKGLEISGEI